MSEVRGQKMLLTKRQPATRNPQRVTRNPKPLFSYAPRTLRPLLLCGELLFIFSLLCSSVCYAELQSVLAPSISAGEEYTDNLFLAEDNTESEWITTVTPGLRYNLSGKTDEITLSYSPTFTYYDKHSEYDGVRHNASIVGRVQMTKHTELTVNDTFLKTEEQINRYEPEDETVRESREPYYTNRAFARISHQFGPADTISLGYIDTLRNHEDPEEEDSKSHAANLNLTYWFQPHLGMDTGIGYTRGEFEGPSDDFDRWNGRVKLIRQLSQQFNVFIQYAHTDMDYLGNSSDYQIYDGSVGMGYTWDEDSSMSLSGGYLVRDIKEQDNEEKFTANIDLNKAWNFKRSSISFNAVSGYKDSYFGADNLGFDWYWALSASARHHFAKHFSGNISGSYRRDKYEDTAENREDYTAVGAAGLSYQPRPWIATALTYSYRDRNSNINTDDFVENTVIFTVTLTSAPYRW